MLARLWNGTTYAQLAAGFGVGTNAGYRYLGEAVDLLAARASTLDQDAPAKTYVLLDGSLLPIDRIAAGRPSRQGKRKKHGVNAQVLADPFGRPLRASPAWSGAVHDIRAVREHGIISAFDQA